MKARLIVIVLGMMIFTPLISSAQVVSKDSINLLKDQKEALEVSRKLNDRKIELAKLENQLAEKNKDAEKTAKIAQSSANENAKVASQLSNDAQDRKLSRRASKAASRANRDSRSARRASESLESLRKNIESLRSIIAQDESKLAAMPGYKAGL